MLGFALDALDVMLYVFALQSLRSEFGWTNAQAGLVNSAMLVAAAAGGILAGVLSDRIGRRRTLIYTILLYSFASAGAAFSRGLGDLVFWRVLVGLGLGGEWSAGATLVAESWPAEHRGKAASVMQSGWALGYMAAAAISTVVLPRFGWRALFLVGVLPALVTLWIRRHVEEPAIWLNSRASGGPGLRALFRAPLGGKTLAATACASAVLLGYWGLFTWLPAFLGGEAKEGGAALGTATIGRFLLIAQAGAFFGYLSFGWAADRIGRRPAFATFVLAAAALIPVYGSLPKWAGDGSAPWLLALGPLIGFFGAGYFSLFGAMLAELFPTSIRGTAQGFTYNAGRVLSAAAPYTVGAVADRAGIGTGLMVNAGFFVAAAALVFALPETRSVELSGLDAADRPRR
jgi:MFS family permease